MKRTAFGHPKLRRLSRVLGVDQMTATGVLESLWHFAARHAPRGDVGRWPDDEIADGMGCETIPPETLIEGLISSGWLDRSGCSGRLIVHDWPDHADEAVKKRIERLTKSEGIGWAEVAEVSGYVETSGDKKCLPVPVPVPVPEPEPGPNVEADADERVSWVEVQERWNQLCSEFDHLRPMKRPPGADVVRGNYRARLKADPEFWGSLRDSLSRLGRWAHPRRFPKFSQAVQAKTFESLVQGDYEDDYGGKNGKPTEERRNLPKA